MLFRGLRNIFSRLYPKSAGTLLFVFSLRTTTIRIYSTSNEWAGISSTGIKPYSLPTLYLYRLDFTTGALKFMNPKLLRGPERPTHFYLSCVSRVVMKNSDRDDHQQQRAPRLCTCMTWWRVFNVLWSRVGPMAVSPSVVFPQKSPACQALVCQSVTMPEFMLIMFGDVPVSRQAGRQVETHTHTQKKDLGVLI